MMTRRLWLAACLALPTAVPNIAWSQASGIQIDNAWSRPAIADRPGVLYLTISDTGAPDTLTGITTPIAAQAELHESFSDNGVMKMRPVGSLPVEPGKPLAFAPGGYHIMLMGLKQALKSGDSFPITLTFATAGQITTTAKVQQSGATMPMNHGQMGNMPMQGGMGGNMGSKP